MLFDLPLIFIASGTFRLQCPELWMSTIIHRTAAALGAALSRGVLTSARNRAASARTLPLSTGYRRPRRSAERHDCEVANPFDAQPTSHLVDAARLAFDAPLFVVAWLHSSRTTSPLLGLSKNIWRLWQKSHKSGNLRTQIRWGLSSLAGAHIIHHWPRCKAQ